MVGIGFFTFVFMAMAVMFMDDVPNSIKKRLYIKKHPEERQRLNDVHFNFLKDSKKMERCMESFCETNKNVIRDAQKIFFDEFDCRVMRWAERARVQQKIEVKKQKSTAQDERKNLWKLKKLGK